MSSDARTSPADGTGGEPERASSAIGGGRPVALKSTGAGSAPETGSAPSATLAMLLAEERRRAVRPPERIGPYRVIGVLASGGMGTVFLAEDERLGKKVAVKAAHPDLASQPDVLEQIREEGRRLASVKRNAYIARVLTAGDTAIDGVSVPYVAMEYEEGETLGGPISNAWPIQKKIEVFTLVCRAVEALHEQHLVHADIKPSNVMLTGAGGEEPRLIDFGIARVVRRLGGEPGQLCAGTPGYFDPAVGGITGKAPDQRTDIYCLGLTLAAFLAGKEPSADQPSGWPSRGIPPSMQNAAIDADLDAIILRAIERDPAKRWQSVAEFRAALQRWEEYRQTVFSRLARTAVHARESAAMVLARSRVAGVLAISALAGVIAIACLYPVFYASDLGGITQGIALRFARPPAEMTTVRMIDGSDYAALEAACRRHGIIVPTSATGRRVAWAALADKLATVGGFATVGFDLFFTRSDEQNDPILKAALLRLAGVCESRWVVVGMDFWGNSLAPTLVDPDRIKVGSTNHYNDRDTSQPPFLHLAVKRENERLAESSFALLLACAAESPRRQLQVELSKWWSEAHVRFVRQTESGGLSGGEQDVLELPNATIRSHLPADANRFAPGDVVALLPIIPPDQEVLDGVTRTASEVLDMSAADLQAWIGNRIVIIRGREDEKAWWNGRAFDRAYLHAIAVEALRTGQYVRMPSLARALGLTLLGGLFGGVLGTAFGGLIRGRGRLAAALIVAGVCGAGVLIVGAGCVWLGMESGYFINPMLVCLAAALAALGVILLRRGSVGAEPWRLRLSTYS